MSLNGYDIDCRVQSWSEIQFIENWSSNEKTVISLVLLMQVSLQKIYPNDNKYWKI